MSQPRSTASLPLSRLNLVGAIVPTFFALADQWLLQRTNEPGGNLAAAELMAVLAAQIGVLGVLCGRLVEPPWLRWVIYGWGLALMDLNVMWLSNTWEMSLLRTSFLAAQVGLLTIWAVFGGTRWFVRFPVSVVLAAVLCVPVFGPQVYSHDTEALFVVQTAALCLICGVLYSQGYRLRLRNESAISADGDRSAPPRLLQFGIRDVLFWTTALAVILGVAQQVRSITLTAGILASIVLVAALWAALGEGAAWFRWPVFTGIAIFAGYAYTACNYFANTGNATWDGLWDWEYLLNYHLETFLWPPLAGGLLFAALLIFRTRGYRLSRKAPPKTNEGRGGEQMHRTYGPAC